MVRLIYILLLVPSLLVGNEKIKAVIFDFGGVMAHINCKEMFSFLSQTLSVPYDQIEDDFGRGEIFWAIERPQAFWEDYASKSLPIGWGQELTTKTNTLIHPIEGMKDLVIQLKKENIRVALLSNTQVKRSRFYTSMRAYDLFNPIVLSCTYGRRKPQKEVFIQVLKQLCLKADQCLFIDDKSANVKAAKSLGIEGIEFKSKENLQKKLQELGLLKN